MIYIDNFLFLDSLCRSRLSEAACLEFNIDAASCDAFMDEQGFSPCSP